MFIASIGIAWRIEYPQRYGAGEVAGLPRRLNLNVVGQR
jgi:hypothetical protein